MTVAIKIQNTLGIKRAAIELPESGVLEVIGPNASGKTSLAVCAQAVLSHDINPLGLSAAQTKRAYPHDRADTNAARVDLESPATHTIWFPASARLQTEGGTSPLADRASVGLVDYTARSARDVALALQSALLPPFDEVVAKVEEHLSTRIEPADLKGVVKVLKERGWSATQTIYEERAKQSKRVWTSVTGRNYGVRVAADWRPDDWLADFDGLTEQQAETLKVDAGEALADLHRIQAIGELELAEAKQAAEALPAIEETVDGLEAARRSLVADRAAVGVEQLEREADDIRRKLNALQAEAEATLECPKCQTPLLLERGKLVERSTASVARAENDMQGLVDDLAKVEKELSDRRADANVYSNSIADITDKWDEANAERAGLARLAAQADMTLDTPERQAELAQAEQAVTDAAKCLVMVGAVAKATELAATIVRYTDIARAIGPDGIRSKLLTNAMSRLNAGLAVLSDVCGWPLVSASLTGGITSDDRPIAMCSESERWRAQTSIQLTVAALTGSTVTVLDRGDMLDATNRLGLARGLERLKHKTGLTILLCSTGSPVEDSPWPQVQIKDGQIAQ